MPDASPSASASPAPSPSAPLVSFRPTDPEDFTVSFFFDREVDRLWAEWLPRYWRAATLDRSRLTVVPTGGDVTILIFSDPTRRSYGGAGTVVIYPPFQSAAFIHELGHVLHCCYGEGTSNGHFITGEPGIMSDPRCAECLLFSDRELREMGIGR